jgi:hypothetical protein
VSEQIVASNIKAFWLTGHSQGGTTSNRLLRTEFSKTRVDGWLSLAGGRLGANPGRVSLGITPAAPATGSTGTASGTTAATAALATLPDADFSFIFTIGRHEMDEKGLPAESEWAKKYSCGSREAARERRHERGLRVRPEPSDSDVALLGTGARSGYGAGSAVSGLQRRPRRR